MPATPVAWLTRYSALPLPNARCFRVTGGWCATIRSRAAAQNIGWRSARSRSDQSLPAPAGTKVPNEYIGCAVSHKVAIIRVTKSTLSPEYLAIALNSKDVQSQLRGVSSARVIKSLSAGDLKNIRIPVPELDLQHGIVKRVNTAQQLLSNAEQQQRRANALIGDLIDNLGFHSQG